MIPRNYISHASVLHEDSGSEEDKKFAVMSFNVLAQGLSSDSFIKCPAEALEFSYRVSGILKEINRYSTDVICLQEVDMFEQLKEQLPGYEGIWKPKADSVCLKFDGNIGPDGSAIFFKSSTVKLVSQHAVPILVDGEESNQVMLSAHLQLTGGHNVLLVCLHLKAKGGFSEIREKQGKFVLEYVNSQLANCQSVIIAGDLNSDPSEPVHRLLESDGFVCTHKAVTSSHPQYTTCKIRAVDGVEVKQCKTEDYIYYKNISDKETLNVARVLEMPSESSLGEGRLPNLHYPSDHLSMVTDFIISA